METSAALERTILALLAKRRPGATICPSDAARAVSADGWRELMDDARAAAGRLVTSGDVEITQHGDVVDLAAARGPIRIRRTGAGGRAGVTERSLAADQERVLDSSDGTGKDGVES